MADKKERGTSKSMTEIRQEMNMIPITIKQLFDDYIDKYDQYDRDKFHIGVYVYKDGLYHSETIVLFVTSRTARVSLPASIAVEIDENIEAMGTVFANPDALQAFDHDLQESHEKAVIREDLHDNDDDEEVPAGMLTYVATFENRPNLAVKIISPSPIQQEDAIVFSGDMLIKEFNIDSGAERHVLLGDVFSSSKFYVRGVTYIVQKDSICVNMLILLYTYEDEESPVVVFQEKG